MGQTAQVSRGQCQGCIPWQAAEVSWEEDRGLRGEGHDSSAQHTCSRQAEDLPSSLATRSLTCLVLLGLASTARSSASMRDFTVASCSLLIICEQHLPCQRSCMDTGPQGTISQHDLATNAPSYKHG